MPLKKLDINIHILIVLGALFLSYMFSLGYYDEDLPHFLKVIVSLFTLPLLLLEETFNVLELSKDIFESFLLVFVVNTLTLLLMAYAILYIVLLKIERRMRRNI